jgi:hypothetical protein
MVLKYRWMQWSKPSQQLQLLHRLSLYARVHIRVESDLINLRSHIGQTLTPMRMRSEGRAKERHRAAVWSSYKGLAQQLGAELKIEIVNGLAETLEPYRTHELTQRRR